jgi:hypothetical protein
MFQTTNQTTHHKPTVVSDFEHLSVMSGFRPAIVSQVHLCIIQEGLIQTTTGGTINPQPS